MKSLWTTAALVCSASLVNAQVSTPRPPVVAKPAVPAPTPKPRVHITEPMLVPGVDGLLDAPGVTSLFTPGVLAVAPLAPLEPMEPLVALAMPAMDVPPFEFTPMPALAPIAPLMAIDMPSLMIAPTPMAPMAPSMAWDFLPGQGPTSPRPPASDRALEAELRRLASEIERTERENRRALEAQDRAAQRETEAQLRTLHRELESAERTRAGQDRALQREVEAAQRAIEAQDRAFQRDIQQSIREQEMHQRQIQREMEQAVRESQFHARADMAQAFNNLHWSNSDFRVTVPAGWAKQDVADSIWNRARELLNRGEWGEAVSAFRSIPQRYPNSAYAAQAAYYQAFGLFRIGGNAELREALQVLDAAKARYPNAGRSSSEMASLTTRIRGVLANRGDAQAAAELRASASGQGPTCDREEQSVQAEAMNQLSRMEGSNINELITRVLARRDDCAIPLRRTAVFLVGNRRDAQAVSVLSGVARNDPSVDVKVEAINVIGRLPNEEGVTVLEELVRSDDERIQRSAIRALVRHPSARAKSSVRSLVERDDLSERVRSEALSAFNAEQATADDITWLRALYARMTTPTLKARTLSAIVRVGGPEVDQWLATIARDDAQPSEIRATAMRRIGETMSVADLGRLYDGATNRRFRSEVINILGKRKEDAATDKLIEIVKNGTDPSLRTSALQAVASKGDARSQQLLLEIINKVPGQ